MRLQMIEKEIVETLGATNKMLQAILQTKGGCLDRK